jgi:hypothetical protein
MILENLIYVDNDGQLQEFFRDLDLNRVTKKKLNAAYIVVASGNLNLMNKKKPEIINDIVRNLRAQSRGISFGGGSLSDSTEVLDRLKHEFC